MKAELPGVLPTDPHDAVLLGNARFLAADAAEVEGTRLRFKRAPRGKRVLSRIARLRR